MKKLISFVLLSASLLGTVAFVSNANAAKKKSPPQSSVLLSKSVG